MGNYRRGPQNKCSFVITAVMYPMQVAFLTWRNGVVHSLDLCFMYLGSRAAAPDFSREATQDDFSPLQEAVSSRIEARLLPSIPQSLLTSAVGTGDFSYLSQTPPSNLLEICFFSFRYISQLQEPP